MGYPHTHQSKIRATLIVIRVENRHNEKASLDVLYTGTAWSKVCYIYLAHANRCTPKEERFLEFRCSCMHCAPSFRSRGSYHASIGGLKPGTAISTISDSTAPSSALLETMRIYLSHARIRRHASAGTLEPLISCRAES